MILGIDPGLRGALAIRGSAGLMLEVMPIVAGQVDLPTLVRWLKANQPAIGLAYLEQVQGRPGFAVKSIMSAARNAGMIEGVLSALSIPYVTVPANVWTKSIHAGMREQLKAKEKSALAAARLFPEIDFRETPNSKIKHDGLIDAALIAEYGYRLKKSAS